MDETAKTKEATGEAAMDETTRTVRDYYNSMVLDEWNRIAGRPEFLLTCRMLNRYIKPGDTVLDIGGGPGRYSLYLAEKGCDVTLLDLSPENVAFAAEQAKTRGLSLKTMVGDARKADQLFAAVQPPAINQPSATDQKTPLSNRFDHILLMGPMYHLLEEPDRTAAVNAALNLLKPGGILYVSFISMIAGIIFGMKLAPEIIATTVPAEVEYRENFIARKSFAGDAFTKAFFIEQSEILPFMARFPLKKIHFFSQESILSPNESNIMSQPNEIVDLWLDLCEKIWEREDLLSWSEHLMYVGRKIG